MKHTKQEKQLINEHLKMFVKFIRKSDDVSLIKTLKNFQKQHNLIDDESQTITIKIPKGVDYKIEVI